jgi:hypothetical protein
MIFGNSDPAFFAIFVSAELGQGRNSTRLLERLRLEFWDEWLQPSLAALFGRPRPRRWSRPFARPLPGFRPADFEVLAAFPVDRANPPASLAARLRQLRRPRRDRTPDRKTVFAVTERELPSPPLFVRRGEGTSATTTPPLSSPNGAEDDHLVALLHALSTAAYGTYGRQSVR